MSAKKANQQAIGVAPATLVERLEKQYPGATYELVWQNPLQLLIGTILAAQCTDERVNKVTPALFMKYPDARAFADAQLTELEEAVKPTGFYRKKAQTIQQVCKALVERFAGEVPSTMEEMVTLPGVARKTANVVLNIALKLPTGIIVDSHCQRVSQRLGLTTQTQTDKIERDLMACIPKDRWIVFGPALVLHGRYVCTNQKPRCADCILDDICPKIDV